MASFILLAVFTTAWLKTMRRSEASMVACATASWIWACTHGMWFVGVADRGSRCSRAPRWIVVSNRSTAVETQRSYALASLVVAAAATPVGPRLLLAPLATNAMADLASSPNSPAPKFSGVCACACAVFTSACTGGNHVGARPSPSVARDPPCSCMALGLGPPLRTARSRSAPVIAAPLVAGLDPVLASRRIVGGCRAGKSVAGVTAVATIAVGLSG